jgi:hypothetical protein
MRAVAPKEKEKRAWEEGCNWLLSLSYYVVNAVADVY